MAEVVVVGGGLAGLGAALLLVKDGHRVTLLERDPASPPASGDAPWDSWERRGVGQFRMLHFFLARFRALLEAELPEVVAALDAEGMLRWNPIDHAPAALTGGWRDGDERFTSLTGRRPMVEAVLARVADRTEGVTVLRGVAVRGLVTNPGSTEDRAGVPHVVGIETDTGERLLADLVVDASGRRSALPAWLRDIGARPVVEVQDDSGFMYYARHFRSPDRSSGAEPAVLAGLLQPYESISVLTLPADNGTWSVGLITSAKDRALRALRDVDRWARTVRAFPLAAHWLEGEPMDDGVTVMTKIEDRLRTFVVDDVPIATGVLALGDSWACTNPSVGRGASIGLLHATGLRDLLRKVELEDRLSVARGWHELTQATVEPLVRDTLAFDRHRLAEIEAQIDGRSYDTRDPSWRGGQALARAAGKDPDLFRHLLDIIGLNARGVEVFGRPRVAAAAMRLGADPDPLPGPGRAELLELVGA